MQRTMSNQTHLFFEAAERRTIWSPWTASSLNLIAKFVHPVADLGFLHCILYATMDGDDNVLTYCFVVSGRVICIQSEDNGF